MSMRYTFLVYWFVGAFISLLLVLACESSSPVMANDGGDTDTNDGSNDPVSITFTPSLWDLNIEDGVPDEQSFTIEALWGNGDVTDVTDDVDMVVTPSKLGQLNGNVFTTSDKFGGEGTVVAVLQGVSGEAQFTVHVHSVHVDDGAPSDADTMFGGTEDPAIAPNLLYPADGVLLPPNLTDVNFMWDGGAGNDIWKLRFEGEFMEMDIYTVNPSFIPEDWLWDQVIAGNAGLGSVETVVSGTSMADTSIMGVSDASLFRVAEDAVQGGIYYWAASSTVASDYGIYRYDFGNPGQSAEAVYTTVETNGRCVACHALSHDGTRMGLNYDGGDGIADMISISTQDSMIAPGDEYYANFHTFSPDDSFVLSVHQGIFTLRDGTDGTPVETLSLDHVTYPDWSPDGATVAFTRATRDTVPTSSCDWSFHGGQIELMDFAGAGNWGAPEIIVPADPDVNYYYPAISPDNEWVIFNKSSELGAYSGPGDSYSDDDATLWIVSIEGGTPIPLDQANLTGDLRTSWAKWCPFEQDLDGEAIMWFTVSSMRRYGSILSDGELPQIWMAAFSPTKAGQGDDPSWPAFYLPFQDITTNNHIAQWTQVVVDID